MLQQLVDRLRLLCSSKPPGELDEEIQFHIQQCIDANIARGAPPEEARREALVAFGGVESTREECHAQRPGWWVSTILQDFRHDVRYGLRGFRRNPIFTVTVIATVALGMGATTAVFSVVDPILFRSLPYAQAGNLVSVGLLAPIIQQEFMLGGFYYDWREHPLPFSSLTTYSGTNSCDLTEEKPLRLNCARVEQNFLPTLGVNPVLGRNFTTAEDSPHAPRVALISYGMWKQRFASSPDVLNRLLNMDGHPARVVGVLPPGFEMPTLEAADVILPQALDETSERTGSGSVLFAFARLKPEISIEQARAALEPVFSSSLRLAPAQFRKEVHLSLRSLRDRQMHDVRIAAWVLFGAVVAVLLIACANVASLLLARGVGRARELAIRSALGASRTRLIRQFLTEVSLLSMLGAAGGCAVAELLLRMFVALAPEGLPFLKKAHLDLRIILFTIVLALICGVVFGLASILIRPRAQSLGARSRIATSRARMRQGLVVAQLAISLVLLAGGMLLLRSFRNLETQSFGFHTESVLTTSILLGQQAYPTPQSQIAFFREIRSRLQALPGVSVVALSDSLPPGGNHQDHIYAAMAAAGRPPVTDGTGGRVAWRWVSPGYFRALDIPIIKGRSFYESEIGSTDHFVILSKTLAKRMFPGLDPIGQRLQVPKATGSWYTVVGVAQDVKNGGLAGEEEPEYYRLRRDRVEDWSGTSGESVIAHENTVIVKTSLPPVLMARWMRRETSALDPTVPFTIETMNQRIHAMADSPRFVMALVLLFAATGLLLSAIGLYGVISFIATQRTQEVGVRMALGANRLDILGLITWEGGRLILWGGVLGLSSALVVSRLLKSLSFNVGPNDPISFLAVGLLLVLVSLAATLAPARSAMKTEPLVALRHE
jgi:predicted permease